MTETTQVYRTKLGDTVKTRIIEDETSGTNVEHIEISYPNHEFKDMLRDY